MTNNDSDPEPTPGEHTGTTGGKIAAVTAASVVVVLLAQGWSLEECVSLAELLVLLRSLAKD
ncbi:hypothetical protein GA0070607_5065 [Micromonospora coriariae]|uniref:Uncharacterized protein n=1 Tax=Micromonospora coriariae TaxID=285665 RepID=A0A1C4XD12_9ACTN|nr:hypothetical protein [Micromonospora coriariae]SCF06257.1 hypothetical protein GA0070607_5065 [Micromonospora coriariae]